VLDIILSVTFIYLILSLLASEIQELITTIMQWRAEHLKRSIHMMLFGGGKLDPLLDPQRSRETDHLLQDTEVLTDRLYSHPLINTLNQEATGYFAITLRKISARLVQFTYKFTSFLYKNLARATGAKPAINPFARQASAPSYIPPEVFAQTVIETFELSKIGRLLTLARLEEFKHQQLKELVRQIKVLEQEQNRDFATDRLRQIARDWEQIIAMFADGKTPLYVVINRFGNGLQAFQDYCEKFLDPSDLAVPYFLYQVGFFYQKYYSETEKIALIATLKPTLPETIEALRNKSQLLQELKTAIDDPNHPRHQDFANLIRNLPDLPSPLQRSLTSLASRVQGTAADVEEDLTRLQHSIETWFDSSMHRAAGVYRRNARGIAILLGVLVAVLTNADTLFIVDSLSKDSVLRATVTQFAENQIQMTELDPATATPAEMDAQLDQLKMQVRSSLDDVVLPLGWDDAVVSLQAEQEWKLPGSNTPLPFLRRAIGWLISGLAISMGASFWYDLLRKMLGLKVGNVGDTPTPTRQR